MNERRNITIRVKKYDGHLAHYMVTESQAESVMNFIDEMTSEDYKQWPSVSDMVNTKNAIATYYGGRNENE